MISIIVPVYKVEKYLNQCMESLVNQTFGDIEIILINDGSTDGSGTICEKWAEKDKRIRYFQKKNEGLGITRNKGVMWASKPYVTFVDSDDWIDQRFVEVMLQAVQSAGADMAQCGIWKVDDYSGEIIGNDVEHEFLCKQSDMELKSPRMAVAMCRTVYRKAFLIDNQIEMPRGYYEDLATFPLACALANKVILVNENLYFYRVNRKGSIMSESANTQRARALMHLQNEFVKRKLWDKYKTEIQLLMLRHLNGTAKMYKGSADAEKYKEIEEAYQKCFQQYKCAEMLETQYMVFGSYGLKRMVSECAFDMKQTKINCFSSIISLCSLQKMRIKIEHPNSFREEMVRRDIQNGLEELFRGNMDFFFIDFLEERYPIGKKEGMYFTVSDAFMESVNAIGDYEIIDRFSKEAWDIWQKSCDRLITVMKSHLAADKVFLVENYLSERYGKGRGQTSYSNLGEIQKINKMLKRCYEYFKSNYLGINIVTIPSALQYTDVDFPYGTFPYHLSNFAYEHMGDVIKRQLLRRNR